MNVGNKINKRARDNRSLPDASEIYRLTSAVSKSLRPSSRPVTSIAPEPHLADLATSDAFPNVGTLDDRHRAECFPN